MDAVASMKLNLTARDASGQRRFTVRNVRGDTTIQELIHDALRRAWGCPPRMRAACRSPFTRSSSATAATCARSKRLEMRSRTTREIVLHPDVQAGGGVSDIA